MDTSPRPVVFLHIPKTAGMTFHEILVDQYPNRKHMVFYMVNYTGLYEALPAAKKSRIGVIRGHLLYGLHKIMPAEPVYITLLRDPIMRTISGYEFIRTKKDHPFHQEMISKNYSLREFLTQKHVANFDNMHVRFLCGDHSMPFGGVNETHLALAKKNLLEKNMLFGLTEQFDESILYFKKVLGWKAPYYAHINVTTNKSNERTAMDEATREAIISCNRFDLLLYEFAREIFEKNIDELGAGFKAEVGAFKKENERIRPQLQRRNAFREFIRRFIPG